MQTITQKLGAPPVLPPVKDPPSLRELILTITVTTPMAGGGIIAGEIDEKRPIRVPSIRGHLRYWWRIMNLSTPDKDTRESKLWGSTENPGKIYVSISEQPNLHLRYSNNNFDFDNRYGPENYALFSLLPNKQNPGKNIARENFAFIIKLRYPAEFHNDIKFALSAWIYFGGIGARTRRGCGSLSCDNSNLASLNEIITAAPYITLWRKKANDSMSAWSYAVKCYRDYRQIRNKGQGNRPGRSKWPEADSLRQITKRSVDRHKNPITSPIPSFPRAALGLPIIFHFKDRDDPKDITVTPNIKDSSRMASPVITKALCENNTWYSAVIILPHDDIFDVPIKLDGVNRDYNIPSRKGAIYKNTQPMQGKFDAISGLEEYISGDFHKFKI